MIIKSKTDIPGPAGQKIRILPIIPVRSAILFPGQVLTLQLNRPQNLRLIKELKGRKKQIAVAYSPTGELGDKNFDLCQVGCTARIVSVKDGIGKSKVVVLHGIRRVAVKSVKAKNPYLTVNAYNLPEYMADNDSDLGLEEEIAYIIESLSRANPVYAESLLNLVKLNLADAGEIADRIASALHFPIETKQELLEELDISLRLSKTRKIISENLKDDPVIYDILSYPAAGRQSRQTVPSARRTGSPKGYSPIKKQLYQSLLDEVESNKNLPPVVKERCLIEIDRLKNLPPASSDYGTTRQYLDIVLGIPWNKKGPNNFDLRKVKKIIDAGYYGPDKIKDKILERIAIRKLSGKSDEASVLCLAGVSGTGKASLAKAIAQALGKEFIRISVGGMDDSDDIKGVSRTFLSATPGLIAQSLKKCRTIDPVMFIEDLDYLSENAGTALPMSILEAIDPRVNSDFTDDYLGLPIDLSHVFFICSVKSTEEVPDMLLSRLEIIEMPGYIEKEKILIARKYIIPALLKKHGLLKRDVRFNERGLLKMIRNYTLEAGLQSFKRKLELICRFIAKEKASRINKVWSINENLVEKLLGTPEYFPEKPGKKPEIGVATGLAWTGLGGDLMTIEALKMKGSGEVITTGSLGEVMKESIQAAHSYVRSKADMLGIDHSDFDNFDIHIHFPSGAIPKDGPSAGVAVCLVIASVMSERPIPHDIAMTGEVTLRGKVLQVGGLVEKISAAYRAGIPTVFIPKANRKDIKDLPADILKKTRFFLMETVDDIFTSGLKDFVPSSFSLEKLFAEEIEKAKNRHQRRPSGSIAAKSKRKK